MVTISVCVYVCEDSGEDFDNPRGPLHSRRLLIINKIGKKNKFLLSTVGSLSGRYCYIIIHLQRSWITECICAHSEGGLGM